MAKAKIKKKVKNKKSQFGFKKLVLLLFLSIFTLLFAAYAVYFLICMIPTIVAVIVDRGQPRTLGITVGAMNFAGSVPKWFDLMAHSQDAAYALTLVLQPASLLMAYGAAGIGWIIYFFVARFVAVILQRRSEVTIKKINKKQEKLVERWGIEVKS